MFALLLQHKYLYPRLENYASCSFDTISLEGWRNEAYFPERLVLRHLLGWEGRPQNILADWH